MSDNNDDVRYSPGDLLVDGDAEPDDRGSVVVLRYVRDEDDQLVPAEGHEFDDGVTVAAVNEDYPPGDPVVEVAFEGWLDSNLPGWRDILDDARDLPDSSTFYDLLGAYAVEWGVPKQVYAYPESRLAPRRYCPDDDVKAEYVPPFPPAGEPAVWVCPVEDCGNDAVFVPGEPLDALDVQDDERDVNGGEGAVGVGRGP